MSGFPWFAFNFGSSDEMENLAQSLSISQTQHRSHSETSPDNKRNSDPQAQLPLPDISVSEPDIEEAEHDQGSSASGSTEEPLAQIPDLLQQPRSRPASWASEDEDMSRAIELSKRTHEFEERRRWYKGYYTSRPSREPSPNRPPPYAESSSDAIYASLELHPDTKYERRSSTHRRADEAPDLPAISEMPRNQPQTRADAVLEVVTQRSRSSTVDTPTSSCDSKQQQRNCNGCSKFGLSISYCNACEDFFCASCWDIQVAHRPGRALEIPHERTIWSLANKIQDVFAPNLSDEERKQLHHKDMLTSWFGVFREDKDRPLLRDYGRFESLMRSVTEPLHATTSHAHLTDEPLDVQCPSFVSFVGTTGAGKSSLIKLIIDLNTPTGEWYETPVVGAMGSSLPTSTDVHLYLDPGTADSDHPILYADCEGLEGGEREPVSAKFNRERERQAQQAAQNDLNFGEYVPRHVSERELRWANSDGRKSREFAVTQLYPRLLYTFSDVIVFVLKNPKVIEGVLVKLVEWAAKALEKSSNQPVLPHAIIALNASENGLAPDLWDVETATSKLMEEMANTVHENGLFKWHAKFWRDRGREINTVEDLIRSYYSSIKVVRIPTVGRPNLIAKQIEELTGSIRYACKESGKSKAKLRMLLSADDMQAYLQYAFEHFSSTLDSPFDFVQASFTNSPIPADFGGNILKLARQLMETWENRAGAEAIFDELAVMVASCIMLDSTRQRILGTAKDIFPPYLDHLDNALENFCGRHWPCEFALKGKGRCVNVRSGHTKGHQSKSGKILAHGDYWSTFEFHSFREHFANEVFTYLVELLSNLLRNSGSVGQPENKAATELHKTRVLRPFFAHALQGSDSATLSSHTVCFCCLFDVPEHFLPCGHVLCTRCLKSYGTVVDENLVDFWDCPLDGHLHSLTGPLRFRLKPEHCGVRVLSLDGGGVRGISELEILYQLERTLGGNLQVHNFFDLVVGTSTGGIIALGLASRGWSVEDCIQKFESLCQKAFRARKMAKKPVFGLFVQSFFHSLYETKPFTTALTEAFTADGPLFGGSMRDLGNPPIKLAVTTAAANSSVILTNYNRAPEPSLPYHFERPEKASSELRVWEAARATSAAPFYFTPFTHPTSKQTYIDGGIYHNNPINIAERERKLIWPSLADDEADVIVSLGTGRNQNTYLAAKTAADFKKLPSKGIISQGVFLANMAKEHIAMSMDSEQTWRDFRDTKALSDRFRYRRLNTDLGRDPPRLDDIGAMSHLRKTTREQYQESVQIRKLARHLVATSFYFEPDHLDSSKYDEVSGYIRCRIPNNDPKIADIGNFIYRTVGSKNSAYFLVTEHDNSIGSGSVIKLDQALEQMVQTHKFQLRQVRFRTRNRIVKTRIALCYDTEDRFPISGFPRRLSTEPSKSAHDRKALTTTSSTRWAGRSPSQKQRDWKPQQRTNGLQTGELLSQFTNSSHVLGNATIRDIELKRRRLIGDVDQNLGIQTDGIGLGICAEHDSVYELGGGQSPVELPA